MQVGQAQAALRAAESRAAQTAAADAARASRLERELQAAQAALQQHRHKPAAEFRSSDGGGGNATSDGAAGGQRQRGGKRQHRAALNRQQEPPAEAEKQQLQLAELHAELAAARVQVQVLSARQHALHVDQSPTCCKGMKVADFLLVQHRSLCQHTTNYRHTSSNSAFSDRLQVVELASWLTSNARLLLEVGTKRHAQMPVVVDQHNGGLKAKTLPGSPSSGFRSDQVMPFRLIDEVSTAQAH